MHKERKEVVVVLLRPGVGLVGRIHSSSVYRHGDPSLFGKRSSESEIIPASAGEIFELQPIVLL